MLVEKEEGEWKNWRGHQPGKEPSLGLQGVLLGGKGEEPVGAVDDGELDELAALVGVVARREEAPHGRDAGRDALGGARLARLVEGRHDDVRRLVQVLPAGATAQALLVIRVLARFASLRVTVP